MYKWNIYWYVYIHVGISWDIFFESNSPHSRHFCARNTKKYQDRESIPGSGSGHFLILRIYQVAERGKETENFDLGELYDFNFEFNSRFTQPDQIE